MKTKPFRYQKKDVIRIDALDSRAGLFHEMGLGKTLITLGSLWRNRAKAFPVVIVCPAAVKYQWADTIKYEMDLDAEVLEGRKPKKEKTTAKFIIVNFEIAYNHVDWIRSHKIKTVVVDECQRISNLKAKCTKAVKAISRGVRRRLALSGTPLQNRPIELFSVANWLRPDVFPSRWDYAQKFCAPKYNPRYGWDVRGVSRPKELARLLEDTFMIRHTKQEVLSDLPEKVRKVVTLPLSDYKEYKEANENFGRWLFKQDPAALRRAQRAATLTKITKLLQLTAKLKMQFVLEWVDKFFEQNPAEKLVLFFTHTDPLMQAHHESKHESVVVNGNVTGKKRSEAIARFTSDPKAKLFLGNIQAAGTGVDGLQRVANTAAFVELDWRPGTTIQAEDRLYRIGQKHTTWIYYLLAHGTIEMKLAAMLQNKQDTISTILDKDAHAKDEADALSIFDMLLEAVISK